jgi:L-ribulose-5-phosphate 3-epimerase
LKLRMNRRELLASAAGVALATGAGHEAEAEQKARPAEAPQKAVMFTMLPNHLPLDERFRLAKNVGFAAVEAPPITDRIEAEKMRAAAERAGIRIHSVIYGGWDPPLSSPDPAQAERSLENARAALHSAKNMGADDILLVPAVVDAHTRYIDAYKRSQDNIHKLIPLAADLQIMICIEEVWNNFLLSPLEYVAYIDSFKSKWVQAYFDVGNVVAFAWPQDWIRTLGKRIKKVHLKDYKGGPGLFGGTRGDWANLRDGSIDWPEVRRAFAEVEFTGFMTTELGGGDEAYLRDVSERVDKIIAGV